MLLTTLILLCSSLFSVAYANTNKISITPLILDNLEESQSRDITVRLSSPIQCDNPHILCNVVLRFTNPIPDEISIVPCLLEWDVNDWETTKIITITALEDFIDDGERELTIITEPLISSAVFYENVNPSDITVHTRSRPTGHCSSTGDPHLTTFDGYRYHFYGRGYVRMVSNPDRLFEVQAITHGGGYSRNCAVAVREKNDLVIMDACDGSFEITERITSTGDSRPSIYSRGGNQYIVEFASGAQVKVNVWGNNMNVYIDVPGVDWQSTTGMCGTFDGNSNNEGVPSYIISNYNGLPAEWRIEPEHSLWRWFPSASSTDNQNVVVPGSQTCEYIRPLRRRNIISGAHIEDITDLIISTRQRNTDKNYTFIPSEDNEAPPPESLISEEVAQALCNERILDDPVGIQCQHIETVDLNVFVRNCVEDLVLMGEEEFMDNAYNDMVSECETAIYRDIEQWREDSTPGLLLSNLCLDGCSRNGLCIDGECVCASGYAGPGCLVNINKPATVHSIYPVTCDFNDLAGCGDYIRVNGENFLNSSELVCHYEDTQTSKVWLRQAKYLGVSVVFCPTPTNVSVSSIINIKVVNTADQIYNSPGDISGSGWCETSPPHTCRMLCAQLLTCGRDECAMRRGNCCNYDCVSDTVSFIWHDFCHSCDEDESGDITCGFTDNTCHIRDEEDGNDVNDGNDWMSYYCARGRERSLENPCLICNPDINNTEWTYDTEGRNCLPHLVQNSYTYDIIENTYQNISVQLDITNRYVPAGLYNISFRINSNYSFAEIDKYYGLVKINGNFNYEENSLYVINVYVVARNGLVVDRGQIRLYIIDENEAPIVNNNTAHIFNITYDLAMNRIYYDSIRIVASDPDTESGWNTLSYSILDDYSFLTIGHRNGYVNVNEVEMLRYLRENRADDDIIFIPVAIGIRDGAGLIIESTIELHLISASFDWLMNSSVAPTGAEAGTGAVEATDDYSTSTTTSPDVFVDSGSLSGSLDNVGTGSGSGYNNRNTFTISTTDSPRTTVFNVNDQQLLQASQDSKNNDDGVLIVGLCLSFVALIMIIIYVKHRQHLITIDNTSRPMLSNPVYSVGEDRNNGKNNNSTYATIETALYEPVNCDWYNPSLTEQEIQEILLNKGQGAFIVSKHTANNYFFVIKNDNRLVKQDIIYQRSQGFYLYGVEHRRYFNSLKSLVVHYSSPQREFSFQLVSDLPVFDNAHLNDIPIAREDNYFDRSYHNIQQDGPPLPSKLTRRRTSGTSSVSSV